MSISRKPSFKNVRQRDRILLPSEDVATVHDKARIDYTRLKGTLFQEVECYDPCVSDAVMTGEELKRQGRMSRSLKHRGSK
jgi:hypothetical protein